MLDRLIRFLENGDGQQAEATLDLPQAVATLLAEAALSDGTLAPEEEAAIGTLVGRRFGLSTADAQATAEQGLAQARQATDLWRAARRINDKMSETEKIDLMVDLWRIVLADGRVDDFEAALMRKLAGLLYIRDQDAGAARKQAETTGSGGD